MVERLLGEANRIFEESVVYFPADTDERISAKATRELIDTADYASSTAPQSFRRLAFSFRAADLTDSAGKRITPRRGDMLAAKDGTYRLIEYGGVAYTPRFDAGFSDRILIYFEREKEPEHARD